MEGSRELPSHYSPELPICLVVVVVVMMCTLLPGLETPGGPQGRAEQWWEAELARCCSVVVSVVAAAKATPHDSALPAASPPRC
ncbi:hypothetical protein E2C01_009944 [Portunus trituberculatus]|uniref:Uncharacterized protein n=1 Tax=Portunus trituberculatus TaxID=210409 RepID=A0A5B7D727_PORTR|nr:hypothetical protein [Portunus trituberculatus]